MDDLNHYVKVLHQQLKAVVKDQQQQLKMENVEKFNYLMSLLAGSPLGIIICLKLTNAKVITPVLI